MTLLEKITGKTARVGVVGLPLAVEKAMIGFTVIGIACSFLNTIK
ncbi:hypothetical protein [Aminivibrio sp.]|jgi:UDP-N-acetyl-D-mannosaminuronate dehydrogenase